MSSDWLEMIRTGIGKDSIDSIENQIMDIVEENADIRKRMVDSCMFIVVHKMYDSKCFEYEPIIYSILTKIHQQYGPISEISMKYSFLITDVRIIEYLIGEINVNPSSIQLSMKFNDTWMIDIPFEDYLKVIKLGVTVKPHPSYLIDGIVQPPGYTLTTARYSHQYLDYFDEYIKSFYAEMDHKITTNVEHIAWYYRHHPEMIDVRKVVHRMFGSMEIDSLIKLMNMVDYAEDFGKVCRVNGHFENINKVKNDIVRFLEYCVNRSIKPPESIVPFCCTKQNDFFEWYNSQSEKYIIN